MEQLRLPSTIPARGVRVRLWAKAARAASRSHGCRGIASRWRATLAAAAVGLQTRPPRFHRRLARLIALLAAA
eukprot:NODE_29205_length_453_cov_1.610429.p3 GENE.NODE_29205_length_453_cov_1.610429~~NODE_29205_length_453_cov_1.610429.p3  ORF type:complete len:73 (+),score=8.30 NODE_29205_length_453_cov_1.610429:72-290(+)